MVLKATDATDRTQVNFFLIILIYLDLALQNLRT